MLPLDAPPKPHMMYPAIPVSKQVDSVAGGCDTITLDDNTMTGCPLLFVVGVTTVLTIPLTYVKGWVPEEALAMLVRRMVVEDCVMTGGIPSPLLDWVSAIVGLVGDNCWILDVLGEAESKALVVVTGFVDCADAFVVVPDPVAVGASASIADGEDAVVLLGFVSNVLVGFVSEVVVGPISSLEVDVTVRYATVCTAEAAHAAGSVVQY